MEEQTGIIERIFAARGDAGCWKTLAEGDPRYPVYQHYVPTFRATLWALVQLADMGLDPADERVRLPLAMVRKQFFDRDNRVYSLGNDHFPIPCLNGNMLYLDSCFEGTPGPESQAALDFFSQFQRFDDGDYSLPKNAYCSNTSCYGRHTCYWGVVKLLKGISFVPPRRRSAAVSALAGKCVDFILRHQVCYSSRRSGSVMIKGLDQLTFPTMYKSDYLEILWVLARERVRSTRLDAALDLLQSRRNTDGTWNLERRQANLVTSVGAAGRPNPFVTQRAMDVLRFYRGL